MHKGIIAVMALVLFAVSVNAQAGIGGVRWELTEMNGRTVKNPRAFIEFDETGSRLSGNAGCNRMFGKYELSGQRFKARQIGTTRMACTGNGASRSEAEFLDTLGKADRLRRNGANLTLSSSGGRVLKFRRAKQIDREPPTMDLTAKKWMLRSINGKAVDLTKNAPFLNFDADRGSAGGNSGCNSFGGDYETLGSSIRFGDMIQTMMACEFEGRMDVERGFMDGLRNVNRFETQGNRLTLFRGNHMILVLEGVSK
jgi:heat shock protein HslJ